MHGRGDIQVDPDPGPVEAEVRGDEEAGAGAGAVVPVLGEGGRDPSAPPPPEHLLLGPRRTPHAPTIFRDHLPRVCKRGLGWRARRGGAAERDPEGLVCTKGTGVGAGSEKS